MYLLFGADNMPVSTGVKTLHPGGEWGSGIGGVPASASFFYRAPVNGTLKNLYARARTAGSGAGTVTVKVQVSTDPGTNPWVDTGIGFTVNQGTFIEGDDTANTYSVSKDDGIVITMENSVSAGSLSDDPMGIVELDPD